MTPIQVHAIWHPGSDRSEPSLFLWGEETGRRAISGEAGSPPRPHPRIFPPRDLRTALARFSAGLLYECAEPGELPLTCPTWRGRPLSGLGADPAELAASRLVPWRFQGLFVPPADALTFLCGLPTLLPSPFQPTDALRYWMQAADLTLGLLARQRFVPTIATITDHGRMRRWSAHWRPVLTDPEDREAVRQLADGMPWICRLAGLPPGAMELALGADRGVAAGGNGTTGAAPAPPAAGHLVLRDFIATVLDAAVRPVLAEEGFPDQSSRRGEPRGPAGPLGTWLRALGWLEGDVDGEPSTLEEFAREVRRWNEALEDPTPGSFRTSFRLMPPGTDDPAEGDAPWVLEFLIQDRSDPETLVPAARIWENSGAGIPWAGRTAERPQDRLLEDLGRASRIFPPLDRALETAGPTSCALSAAEAHTFLRLAAPLLEESGFGIVSPAWWKDESSRPRLRLRLRPGEAAPGAAVVSPVSGAALVAYDWEIALGDDVLSPEEFRRLAGQQKPLVHLRGRWVELDPERTGSIHALLEELPEGGTLTLSEAVRWSAGGPDPLHAGPTPEVVAEGWVSDLIDRLEKHDALQPITSYPGFQGTLRPYQERGVAWLEFLRGCGLGACLADDMGLGKTVQLIALLLHERREDAPAAPGPTLVLCPMSVVGNWQREIERFAPSLRVLVHHGLRRRRDQSFEAEARTHDVVVTTFALAHRDRSLLRSVEWERMVLDEAQNLKNPGTLQARAVRSLRARTRVALTGTPLENRLSELWSILEILNPGYLGSRAEFRRSFALPIERNRDPRRRETLRRLIMPFLLRRLKTDPEVIRDLPEKLEMDVYCNLTREQAGLYQAVVDEMMEAIERAEGITRRGMILATLTRLKQICNHPAQYLRDAKRIEGRSGKVERLAEMLEEVLAVGERALVFTQYTEMGHILEAHLGARLKTELLFLHGGTPKGERDRMIERFAREDAPPIFLLSLRAGGTGLNLTPANHVFHFDRWWNPAVEDQATDRAFRIGQTRNVQVHKFVCVGTLEERIDRLIREKRELASLVVGSGEQWLTELDTRQLREVLMLSRDAVSED